MKKILLTLISIGLIVGIGAVFFLYACYKTPNKIATEEFYTLEYGTSVKALANDLQSKELVPSALVFQIVARLQNVTLKAGEYQIPAYITIRDLLALLQSGKTFQRRLTIPEGLTVKQIVILLDGADGLTGTVETLPVEGTLLPETYAYSKGDSKQDIIKRMQASHNQIVDRFWESRDVALPYKTKEEAVTMASIVERETGVKEERKKVAGVFLNRLNKGIMLQSDPTIIYPLSDKLGVLDRPLYRKDWKYVSPYNTYMVVGLPPTPIANPGLESLEAALNPELHDYFYFVADGTGGHTFSKTLEEHNANVTKWRKIKKERNIEQ